MSRDAEGKRALFSSVPAEPVRGAVTIGCSSCGETTTLAPLQAVRALLPSLHVPVLRRTYPSLLRCPACHRLTWTRLGVHF